MVGRGAGHRGTPGGHHPVGSGWSGRVTRRPPCPLSGGNRRRRSDGAGLDGPRRRRPHTGSPGRHGPAGSHRRRRSLRCGGRRRDDRVVDWPGGVHDRRVAGWTRGGVLCRGTGGTPRADLPRGRRPGLTVRRSGSRGPRRLAPSRAAGSLRGTSRAAGSACPWPVPDLAVVRRPGLRRCSSRRAGHPGSRTVLGADRARGPGRPSPGRPGGRPAGSCRRGQAIGPGSSSNPGMVIRRLPGRPGRAASARRIPRRSGRSPSHRLAALRHPLHRAVPR